MTQEMLSPSELDALREALAEDADDPDPNRCLWVNASRYGQDRCMDRVEHPGNTDHHGDFCESHARLVTPDE